MAEMRSASRHFNSQQWSADAKQKAKQLIESANQIAEELFSHGDLTAYLAILCRLPNYHVHNLLLILRQYPTASYLTGFKLWQKKLPDLSSPVLRPEWRGKGIDLLAPYTEWLGPGKFSLTWYAIKQFDISQTTLDKGSCPESFDPAVTYDVDGLTKAITAVLYLQHNIAVMHTPRSSELRAAALVGKREGETLLVRDDVKPEHRLYYLCDFLTTLLLDKTDLPFDKSQKDVLIQYILYCLFHIWGMDLPRPLYQKKEILTSIQKERQIEFLDTLQRLVLKLEESIKSELIGLSLPTLNDEELS